MRLPVIENYEYLRNIRVPPGVYLSNKVLCTRPDRFSYYSDDSEMNHEDKVSPPSLSAYPSPAPSAKSSPVLGLPRLFMPVASQNRIILPPISTMDSKGRTIISTQQPSPPYTLPSSPMNYTPLSPEDKRALDSFRVVL